jgi:hypothetical protein
MSDEIIKSFLEVCPSILWFFLVVILLILFREKIQLLATAIAWRVKIGAQVKIASFEMGETNYVAPNEDISKKGGVISIRDDTNGRRKNERGNYYLPNRDIFLVHRISPSKKLNQLYDILIYVIPHKNSTIVSLQRVEYFFGNYWRDKVFISTDRASGFSITTSAFGPFVCTAELFFTDGKSIILSRYIDFEMGAIGKC